MSILGTEDLLSCFFSPVTRSNAQGKDPMAIAHVVEACCCLKRPSARCLPSQAFALSTPAHSRWRMASASLRTAAWSGSPGHSELPHENKTLAASAQPSPDGLLRAQIAFMMYDFPDALLQSFQCAYKLCHKAACRSRLQWTV